MLRRRTVEEALALDLVRLVRDARGPSRRKRARCRTGSWRGTATWRREGREVAAVGWTLALGDAGALTLDYRADGVPVSERVELATARPRYGGRRWWACCPGCGRRCGALYLGDGARFRCRLCCRLTYRSAQAHNARVDALRRGDAPRAMGAAPRGTVRGLWAACRALRACELGPYTPRRRRARPEALA